MPKLFSSGGEILSPSEAKDLHCRVRFLYKYPVVQLFIMETMFKVQRVT